MGRKNLHKSPSRWGCIICIDKNEPTKFFYLNEGKLQVKLKSKKRDTTSKFEKFTPNSSSDMSFSLPNLPPQQPLTNEIEASSDSSFFIDDLFIDESPNDSFPEFSCEEDIQSQYCFGLY